jgi:hypothetical protein
VIDVERSLGCVLHSVHIAVVLLAVGNVGYMYQAVVKNLWMDNTKKVPSIVVAFCVGMVEDMDASGHVYSLDRTRM